MYGGRLRTDQTSMITSLNWIVLSKRTPHTNGFIAYITVCQYHLLLLAVMPTEINDSAFIFSTRKYHYPHTFESTDLII